MSHSSFLLRHILLPLWNTSSHFWASSSFLLLLFERCSQYLTAFMSRCSPHCDYSCGLYEAVASIFIITIFKDDFIIGMHVCVYVCVCVQDMSFEHTSVTFSVITLPVSNAYCIINHRLHTSWQCWRGTKSTVASQPGSVADRCWWLLNQLWLPRGSCRCVCVCVCEYFKCVFISAVHTTPLVFFFFLL